jgi:hypothetical protein
MKLEKSELKYLGLSYLLIIALAVVMGVKSIADSIDSWNPIMQFLILNIGIYFIVFFLIKGFSLGLGKKRLFAGALGSVFAFLSLDLLIPEYHINFAGQFLTGGQFSMSSTDYFMGYLYNHFLGISGTMLWILVYPVTFTILFFLGALLIDNFIKNQI